MSFFATKHILGVIVAASISFGLACQALCIILKERRRILHKQYKSRVYRIHISFLNLSEREVIKLYRMNKETIRYLLLEYGPLLESKIKIKTAVPPLVKLLSVLHFCATGLFQETVAFAAGIMQSPFSIVLNQVTNLFLERRAEYIVFPKCREVLSKFKPAFYEIANFPNVIGAVDCTHVLMIPPRDDEITFCNRKHSYSVNIQAVCTHDLMFTNCCARFLGSSHDSTILQQSELPDILADPMYRYSWLLGDAGYALKNWLLTPIRIPKTVGEERFNAAHIKTRNTIKRAFGVLKSRFRCLHRSGGALHYNPDKILKIVVLCVILHNIACRRKIAMPEEDDLPEVKPLFCGEQRGEPDEEDAVALRASLAMRFFRPNL